MRLELNLRPAPYPFVRYVLFVVTGSLAVALAVQMDRYERDFVTNALDWKSIALVLAFVLFLASGFALVSRRVLASLAQACALMVCLTTLSVVKFGFLRASLHALDFYYYGRPTEILFLTEHFPKLFFGGVAVAVSSILVLCLLAAIDDTRVARSVSVSVLCASALLLGLSYEWRGQRSKVYHFNGLYHVSAAIASAPEAMAIFFRGGFLKGAAMGGKIDSQPMPRLQNAIAGAKPPTIISILHESSFPTRLFPAIQCGGPVPSSLYTSSNGKRYDLRVETYGGATWLTEYGLVLGISTYYFGEARSFIGYTMQGRVHDSLPLQLRKDGYRSVALYPSPQSFVNTGLFYKSIGFDEILDYYDLDASSEHERDRFYYRKALDVIRGHLASGGTSPLFIDLWTMATHAPYDYTIFPELEPKADTICAEDDEWSEYIRRLLLSEEDLKWFSDKLKAEFPDQPFMIVGYGDHQPFLSREFLQPSPGNPSVPARNSAGYKTFFRITGINFEPDWSVVPPSVDMPFLGNVMMLAARQPRHGYYNDRDKLMLLCRGRYNDCPQQDEILSFHERMIQSSTIVNK